MEPMKPARLFEHMTRPFPDVETAEQYIEAVIPSDWQWLCQPVKADTGEVVLILAAIPDDVSALQIIEEAPESPEGMEGDGEE